jgi:hypothetical protein
MNCIKIYQLVQKLMGVDGDLISPLFFPLKKKSRLKKLHSKCKTKLCTAKHERQKPVKSNSDTTVKILSDITALNLMEITDQYFPANVLLLPTVQFSVAFSH